MRGLWDSVKQFDWRLFLSIGVCLFGMLSVLTFNERTDSVEYLRAEGDRKDQTIIDEQHRASKERQKILKTLQDFQEKYYEVLAINQSFIDWFRNNGMAIPDEFIAPGNRIYLESDDETDDGDSSNGDSGSNGQSSGNSNSGSSVNPTPSPTSNSPLIPDIEKWMEDNLPVVPGVVP